MPRASRRRGRIRLTFHHHIVFGIQRRRRRPCWLCTSRKAWFVAHPWKRLVDLGGGHRCAQLEICRGDSGIELHSHNHLLPSEERVADELARAQGHWGVGHVGGCCEVGVERFCREVRFRISTSVCSMANQRCFKSGYVARDWPTPQSSSRENNNSNNLNDGVPF